MEKIQKLANLDFEGKGEGYVEQAFLYPLLEQLGYDSEKDYEVLIHGDEDASFKLKYPPVKSGAKPDRTYNPDYVPTIRKKAFWIIDAKSPKNVSFPFDYSYVVQGLQYSIHPEIQAHYMVLSNGKHTSIYKPYKDVYFGKEKLYEPVISFSAKELPSKWNEIYNILSTEKIRAVLEEDLHKLYEKIALSSFDKNYPHALIARLGQKKYKLSQKIDKQNAKLYVKECNKREQERIDLLRSLSSDKLFYWMENPINSKPARLVEANFYIEKVVDVEDNNKIFKKLINGFKYFSIFRKEQVYCALCLLHNKTQIAELKPKILDFLSENMKLTLLNEVECLQLRVTHKLITIEFYPKLRQKLDVLKNNSSEIVRHVFPPSAIDYTKMAEIIGHDRYFATIRNYTKKQLEDSKNELTELESSIEEKFIEAQKKKPDIDSEIMSLGYYGKGHELLFQNIVKHFGLGHILKD